MSPEIPVCDVARRMRAENIRHVLVLDGETLVGIVSNRDVRGPAREREPAIAPATPIAQVMTEAPIAVWADTPLTEAARAMLDAKIGALPVLEDLRVVGILTKSDALEALLQWAELRDR